MNGAAKKQFDSKLGRFAGTIQLELMIVQTLPELVVNEKI